jgi:hypothetical protein
VVPENFNSPASRCMGTSRFDDGTPNHPDTG